MSRIVTVPKLITNKDAEDAAFAQVFVRTRSFQLKRNGSRIALCRMHRSLVRQELCPKLRRATPYVINLMSAKGRAWEVANAVVL